MKIRGIVALSLLFGACASLPPPSIKVSSSEVLRGSPNFSTSSKIKAELSRSAYRDYTRVTAHLITDSYLEADQKELGQKNMDPQDLVKKRISEQKQAFTRSNTCFAVTIETITLENAKFENWRAKVEFRGNLIEANFSRPREIPTPNLPAVGWWTGVDYACIAQNVPLEEGLTLHVLPQLIGEPFKLSWSFEDPKISKQAKR